MITVNGTILTLNGVNKVTSNRAGYFYNYISFIVDEDILEKINTRIEKAYSQGKFCLTKNAIRNYLIFSYIEKYQEELNSLRLEDKFLDVIHGLAQCIDKGDLYLDLLSQYVNGEKISFTTKRNIFISLIKN